MAIAAPPSAADVVQQRSPVVVVVMGASGCGKSTVAIQLAQALQLAMVDGDDWHSPHNIARMASGFALTDADRQDWLELLCATLATAVRERRGTVLACSALKRRYRDTLRSGAPGLLLVYLHGARALLQERMAQRMGHYMPASLLDSQLEALEPPGADENMLDYNVELAPARIVEQVLASGRV
ncbi:MAG: gluconokinase [Rhodoferax sp.]|nr:gluconokinase [Rhodoferax sp.]